MQKAVGSDSGGGMLVLLSPAKTMATSPPSVLPPNSPTPTIPALLDETRLLVACGQALSVQDLAAGMKISPALAQQTAERFAAFSLPFTASNSVPALLAFGGEVYRGLDAASLSGADLAFAQEHLMILSGLYGVLRALDRMQPYRLEMGSRLQTPRGQGLYRFWGDRLTKHLRAQVARQEGGGVVLNLASAEYASALQLEALDAPVVTPIFQEAGGRVVAVHAKRARGRMARAVVQQRLESPAQLRDYTDEGYRLQAARSTASVWLFAR